MVAIVAQVFEAHGLVLSWKPGKSEMGLRLAGPGSRVASAEVAADNGLRYRLPNGANIVVA
eukprot:5988359-Lingulodinium_polyedra.AAC.1